MLPSSCQYSASTSALNYHTTFGKGPKKKRASVCLCFSFSNSELQSCDGDCRSRHSIFKHVASVGQRATIARIGFAEATFEVFEWPRCYSQLEDCCFTYLHKQHTPVSLVTWLSRINNQKVILKGSRLTFGRRIGFLFFSNNTWFLLS